MSINLTYYTIECIFRIITEICNIFNKRIFPISRKHFMVLHPYILEDGGKRIRPVLCLMGNELFGPINPDAWNVATALELFHNFTLIHDDIMDKAPLRRGKETVHAKFGESTALLAGDVMLVHSYEYLNKTNPDYQNTDQAF